jgi:hypothetical protein
MKFYALIATLILVSCGGGGSHMTGGAGGTGGADICGHETFCDVPPDAGMFVPYCADVMIDNNNCGACGVMCVGLTTCRKGICASTGPVTLACESKAGVGHECIESTNAQGMCAAGSTKVSACSTSNTIGTCAQGTTETTYYQDGGYTFETVSQACKVSGGIWTSGPCLPIGVACDAQNDMCCGGTVCDSSGRCS